MNLLKGIYVLIISVNESVIVRVGALREILFETGLYVYIGSAQGGFKQRVKRHLIRNKKRFWHIDYLLSNDFVKILQVFYKKAGKSEECRIASKLTLIGVSLKHFGSSDCNCESHLFRIKCKRALEEFLYDLGFCLCTRYRHENNQTTQPRRIVN